MKYLLTEVIGKNNFKILNNRTLKPRNKSKKLNKLKKKSHYKLKMIIFHRNFNKKLDSMSK